MRECQPEGRGDVNPAERAAGGPLVVRLMGEFDNYSERLFLECIQDLLSEGHEEVCFDFSAVHFADTCGLRCLFQAQRQFRRTGRRLVLTGLPEGLQRILQMVRSQALMQAAEHPEATLPSGSLTWL
jgi:anti-anti-sigma factor